MPDKIARRVLLIGWDAADWKIITPLLDQGRMPHLARLIDGGVMGNLASISPMLSPMLWTSIATGKRPHKHGILGFTEPDPSGNGVRPTLSTSRRSKALWNILTQSGLRSIVTGWFASHPAEPIDGVFVSEAYGKAPPAEPDTPWPLSAGAVQPMRLEDGLAGLRVHPSEIDGYSLLPFVPRAAEIDQSTDGRLAKLATDLAECVSIHAAATWLLESEPWDFAAVYYNTIDHLCHKFMWYHPPRMHSVPEADCEFYGNVVAEAYCFHDMMLGRLLELAGEDTTVILCSDHGYHSDHLRPRFSPGVAAGPAVWHRRHGILVARGPHIRRDERLYGSVLLDIAPTILRLFGLPVGEDMDGKVLERAFERPVEIERIPSWEQVEGESGMHPPGTRSDPVETEAVLRQMVALGYMDPPSPDATRAAATAAREAEFNLAQALLDANLPGEALPVLERLHSDDPAHLFIALNLANCYQQTGRRADCRALCESLIARSRDPLQPAFGRPKEDPRIAASHSKGSEGPRWIPEADLLLGMLDVEEGRPESAEAYLRRAELADPSNPHIFLMLGRSYLALRKPLDAERAFQRAVAIDPDYAQAHDGLAQTALVKGRFEEAAQHALDAVGLLHHFAPGHYHLGVALAQLGMTERAIRAFETSLSIAGGAANDSHNWLQRLRGAG